MVGWLVRWAEDGCLVAEDPSIDLTSTELKPNHLGAMEFTLHGSMTSEFDAIAAIVSIALNR